MACELFSTNRHRLFRAKIQLKLLVSFSKYLRNFLCSYFSHLTTTIFRSCTKQSTRHGCPIELIANPKDCHNGASPTRSSTKTSTVSSSQAGQSHPTTQKVDTLHVHLSLAFQASFHVHFFLKRSFF